MFKPGDRVVCINDRPIDQIAGVIFSDNQIEVVRYQTYTIRFVSDDADNCRVELYGIYSKYYAVRFISSKDYRKQKLTQICLNQEIK